MTPRRLTGSLAAITLLMPALAHAHEGEHSAAFIANVMHWLSGPTHSLFAVLGGLGVAALILRSARKKRA